jgi:hypothetical protein
MRRLMSKRVLAGGVALTVAAGIWFGMGRADAGSSRGQSIAVPAYWTPNAAGAAKFDELVDAKVGLVVVNGPANAAPTPFDPATAAQIRKLYDSGATVLGYVDTGYLGSTGMLTTRLNPGSTRPEDWRAQANQDAADWFRLYGSYGLDGVFLDQVTSRCGADDANVDVYHSIADHLRESVSEAFVALNPGTDAEECYAEVADTMVIFENTYPVYQQWNPPAWVFRYDPRLFWHLVHAAPTIAEMRDAVALSRQRQAGHVYVTDDTITAAGSPWDTLPPEEYWLDEVRQVRARQHG